MTLVEDVEATMIDVLVNDTDVDGDAIEMISVGEPSHGTVTIADDGSGLTYQPDPDYCGPDALAMS